MIEINDSSLRTVKTLPGLFEAITQDPDCGKCRNEEMYPVTIPEDLEAREHVVQVLFKLFRAGLVRLGQTENQHLSVVVSGNYHIIPGAGYEHVSDERMMRSDFESIFSAFNPIIPSPEDPSFPDALRHRVAGLIRLLGHIHNFQSYGRDTGATLRVAAQLTRSTDDGRLIRDVPWEGSNGRLEILSTRANGMEQGYRIPLLRKENGSLHALLTQLYSKLNLYFQFDDVFHAFDETVSRLRLDTYDEVQWRNVLYKKFLQVDSTQVAADTTELATLASVLRSASTIEEFKQRIHSFQICASENLQFLC